jgi:HSP20 family protein
MYQANPTLRSQRIQQPGMQNPIAQPNQPQQGSETGLGTQQIPEIGNIAAQLADLQARQSSLGAQQANQPQAQPQPTSQQPQPVPLSPIAQRISPTLQPSAPSTNQQQPTQQPTQQRTSPIARQPMPGQPGVGQASAQPRGFSQRPRLITGIRMQGPRSQQRSPMSQGSQVSPFQGPGQQGQQQLSPFQQGMASRQPSMPRPQTSQPQGQPNVHQPVGGQGGYSQFGQAPGVSGQPMQGPQARQQITRQPPVDIVDEGEHLLVEFEIPGAEREQIDLVGHTNAIELRAKSRQPAEGRNLVKSERGQVTYMRSIPLGIDIDNEEIEAKFEDGILWVKAPKRDPESGPNRVEVN